MLNTSTNKVQHVCNGSVTDFSFDFAITGETDLKVYLTDANNNVTLLVLNGSYTVAMVGDDFSNGGIVTTTVAYETGYTITIVRSLNLFQDFIKLTTSGKLPSKTIEAAFDRIVMFCQQIQEQVDRSITLGITSEVVSTDEYLELAQLAAATATEAQVIASAAAVTATNANASAVAAAARAETDAATASAANESAEALLEAVDNVAADIGINEVNLSLGKRSEGTAILQYGRRAD